MTTRHLRYLLAACAAAIVVACAATASGPEDAPAVEQNGNLTPSSTTVVAGPNVFAGATAQLAPDTSNGWPLGVSPTWTSLDPTIATVNANGVVVGHAPGMTTIRAVSDRESAVATVNVVPPDDSDIVLIAHRGYKAWYPENTLVAIKGAFDIGADAVEIDIRLSSDNIPVVMHDETVDRTTNGTGKVRDLAYAKLSVLNACAKAGKTWTSCALPSLQDAITAASGRGEMLLHLYGSYTAIDLRGILGMLRAASMERHVVFICFDLPTLRLLRQLDATVPLGYLTMTLPDLDSTAALGRAALIPDVTAAMTAGARSSALLQDARHRRIDNATFTITTQSQGEAAVKLGFRRLISDLPLDRSRLIP